MTTVDTSSSSTILQNYISTYQKSSSTTSISSTSSSSSSATLTADMNTFLKILTTQLQNQDPTNATNTDQFTQELVQFAGVEQQIQTNEKLTAIKEVISPNGVTPVLNYVGKTVEAETDGSIQVQNGIGEFSYTLPSTAQTVSIVVKNSSGTKVATISGSTDSGAHKVSWTAEDSSGNALADGTYTVTITAKDSSGNTLTPTNIDAIGTITSVQTDSDGTATVSMGNLSFSASKVNAVYATSTTTSSSSSSS